MYEYGRLNIKNSENYRLEKKKNPVQIFLNLQSVGGNTTIFLGLRRKSYERILLPFENMSRYFPLNVADICDTYALKQSRGLAERGKRKRKRMSDTRGTSFVLVT